jgi:hypothetical protein
MVHNYEAGDSGTIASEDRSHSLTLNKAAVLYRARMLMPSEYRLPHGWYLSNVEYVVPPLPEGSELRPLINKRKAQIRRGTATSRGGRREAATGRRCSSVSGRPRSSGLPAQNPAGSVASANALGGMGGRQ